MKHILIRRYALVVAVALVILTAFSCKDKKPAASNETAFEQSMTNADSTAVVQLVDQFFGYAENEGYTEAAAMLFQVSTDKDSLFLEPEPLDNEQLNRMIGKLKALKVKSHHIDYVKFNETYLNEVKCTAFLSDEIEGPDAVSTVFYFKPVDYKGAWKLCLMDSRSGDHGVVDANKRDSVKNSYEQQIREKNLQKLESKNSK